MKWKESFSMCQINWTHSAKLRHRSCEALKRSIRKVRLVFFYKMSRSGNKYNSPETSS